MIEFNRSSGRDPQFDDKPPLENVPLLPSFAELLSKYEKNWKKEKEKERTK